MGQKDTDFEAKQLRTKGNLFEVLDDVVTVRDIRCTYILKITPLYDILLAHLVVLSKLVSPSSKYRLIGCKYPCACLIRPPVDGHLRWHVRQA